MHRQPAPSSESDFVVERSDLFTAMNGDEGIVHVERPKQGPYVTGDLLRVELTGERCVNVVQLFALHDKHRTDVFFALKEMPAVGRFRTKESRQFQGVIGVGKNKEVFLRTTVLIHTLSLPEPSCRFTEIGAISGRRFFGCFAFQS